RIDKEFTKAKKTKVGGQFPDVVTKIEGELGSLRSAWESIKAGALSDDAEPDDLRDGMEEIFEGIGEVRQSLGLLKQLSSVSKMVKTAGKEVAKFEKEVARQKKAGRDVAGLTSLLGDAKTKLGEITALSKQTGFDPEDLFDLMQELEHVRNEALQELDRVTGKDDADKLSAAVFGALRSRRLGF
ncbi:MAG: hypothetical protein Q7R64_02960, partial [bacterium]|nr:hypothetical protein [bacterium]